MTDVPRSHLGSGDWNFWPHVYRVNISPTEKSHQFNTFNLSLMVKVTILPGHSKYKGM